MEVKLFEIRDRGTLIAAMATKPRARSEAELYLIARGGYGPSPEGQAEYVILSKLDGDVSPSTCDPYHWSNRTMIEAHNYIIRHWAELASGDVVDVEFNLGETAEKKKSEHDPAFTPAF